MKYFRILKKNKVQFGWVHIKSKKKLEAEVIPSYPAYADTIRSFVNEIHFSFKIVIGILLGIGLLGIVMVFG